MTGGDGAEERVGQDGRVGAVPLDDQFWRSCCAAWHGAGLACVGVRFCGGDAVGLEGLGYAFFEAIVGLDGCAVGEVLDGGEEAVVGNDGDAYGVEVGVENIGAVGGSAHPGLMEGGGVGTAADVFGDGGEVGSGLGTASGHVGLAWVLMLELALFMNDSLGVDSGGAGEVAVPVDGRQVVGGSGLIGELEDGLLGAGGKGLCESCGCCEG